jgi:hypothetical protein
MGIAYHYYEGPTWELTKVGWYECRINAEREDRVDYFLDIMEWLTQKIDKCNRHSRWILAQTEMCFKFRYERDYLLFMLRWG